MNELLTIATGSLVAVSCALLGCFLILRKMAMVGDAISHAVLPGIVLAFIFTGARDSFTMLIGATVFGLLATFIIETIQKRARLQSDASIGITFTWLFAIGVILISKFTFGTDLDQDCVLYGDISTIGLEAKFWGLPDNTWNMLIVLIIILTFIWIGYKGLFLTTFDPAYAAAIGISTTLWHYLLMGMVSMTTVSAFNSVGAILVVAFLVGPPATAYLLTNKLPKMLLIATVLGIISAIGGYYLAVAINGSISGAMVAVVGIEFMLAFLFSPLQGILVKKRADTTLQQESQT